MLVPSNAETSDHKSPENSRKRAARLPWRSATLAIAAQLPVLFEAYFLNVNLTMLSLQIFIVAIVGILVVLAELANIMRWGLSPPIGSRSN